VKVTYDREAQALYIYIAEGLEHGTTEELIPDTVMLDRSKLGVITGIEVLCVDKLEDITRIKGSK